MNARHLFKRLPAKAKAKAKKNVLYHIGLTGGVTALTLQASSPNPNIIDQKIRAGLDGVARCSRAIYAITSSIVDYKYSLHGLEPDSEEYRQKLSEVHLRSAERILSFCEANKGFYVKAGQFVAALRQVPKEYSSTLSSLQDQAVPCNFKAIKAVLVKNLGQDLSDIFQSFDEEPIAAASIAQVHRAVLKDNEVVAIKVQYPGLENQMKIDVTTMSFLASSVSWLFPEYRFEWMVSEFEKRMSLELDFIQEAKNSERTARNFKNNSMLTVPRVFWNLTRSQVLTMKFCSGHKVDDLKFLKEVGINPIKVSKALVEVFAEMIFVHGFVHGDPHPGNILVSPKGRHGFSLVLLDHGVYKELDGEFRLDYCQMWKALIVQDSKKIESLGERFGVGMYSRYFPVIFTGRTINSKSTLGKGMSAEERRNLKVELKLLTPEDISSFMESLPPNFLTILQTDGLLRSIISKLGVPQRVRLLAYAKYAVYGLSTNVKPESGFPVKYALTEFMGILSYIKLRLLLEFLELASQMETFQRSFMSKLKKIYGTVGIFIGGHSLPAS